MTYHLNRSGQDLGVCSLEQLQARRASGDLTGSELVWTEGMKDWQPVDFVLSPKPTGASTPLRSVAQSAPTNKTLLLVLGAVAFGLFIIVVVSAINHRVMLRQALQQFVKQLTFPNSRARPTGGNSAMSAASRPIVVKPGTRTAIDVIDDRRAFRLRQYVDGYKLRGERNPESDALALGYLGNWIAYNYSGDVDKNLPSIPVMTDQLANDPDCTDPLVLTVTGVEAVQLNEGIRRLERAVKGFENSKHLGYPKFYATVMLASKVYDDRKYRVQELDAQALQYFRDALNDGSLQPGDQPDIGETLVSGWAKAFFKRNEAPVYTAAKSAGTNFQWLALVLQGESEINEAWRQRGDGGADTVTEAGWHGFNSNLGLARKSLTQAWHMNPKWPLAPARMMTVALGDSDIGAMRTWFDRAIDAQLDYDDAWSSLRWGLRPRWFGDTQSMLAIGVTALNTRRFDTDVPRKYFDAVKDVESEMDLPVGEHIYGRADVWPHLQTMYEGYIEENKKSAWSCDGWRSAYSVVAYLAGEYDASRQQLQALNWTPHPYNLLGWDRDLSVMPLEVAARTGLKAKSVADAENRRESEDAAGALRIYDTLLTDNKADNLTLAFARERHATLSVEKAMQSGNWVPFLPTDANFTGWHINYGDCALLPDGAVEVRSDQRGHILYSRVRVGCNFEVRGQFEVVNSTTGAFQGGIVMGLPQEDHFDWYAFRVKRNPDEGEIASFSQNFTRRQITAHAKLDDHINTFDFTYRNGRVSATVNGQQVFNNAPPLKDAYVNPGEFLVGLGAFNNSNGTTLRYRNIEVRKLSAQ